ncbi:putative wd domain-containing protein, partial [Botrytis fragariae]
SFYFARASNLYSTSGTSADFVLADDNPHIPPPSLSIPDDPPIPTSPPRSTSTVFSAQAPLPPSHHRTDQIDPPSSFERYNIDPTTRQAARTRGTPQAELRPRRAQDQVLGRRRRDHTIGRGEQLNTFSSPGDSSNPSNLESEHRNKRRRQSASMRSEGEDSTSNGSSKPFSNGAGTSRLHKAALSNSANGAHSSSAAMNGSSTNGHSDAGVKATSTYFGHDREEVTRILIQALTNLGYNGAAARLSQESGYDLESPIVAAFRNAVLQGEWTEAEELLFGRPIEEGGVNIHGNGLVLRDGVDKNIMRFWMRQQKFLELLERKDMGRAINVLRSELTPLYQDTAKLHFLSSLLMCTPADLKVKANWDGAAGDSRHLLLSQLSRCISPSAMLPENRLATLFDQVKQHQISTCVYHNTHESPSLYQDHTCDRSNVPLRPIMDLTKHAGEVWDTKFSHDGTLLASCGSDGVLVIYNVPAFSVHTSFSEHEGGVCSFAWSPDDTRMVTCGRDNRALLWNTATSDLLMKLPRFGEPVSCCVWTSDGQSFITGSLATTKNLCQWNLNGELVYDWGRDHRIRDIALTPDGSRLVAIEHLTHLYVYNFITRELEYELDLKVQLCSIGVSDNSRHLLIHCNSGETRMLDIDTGETIRTFVSGDKGGEFIIRSSFGGANESFVVSGSEEGNVVIYHRENGSVVEKLEAHKKGCCNAVSWNPVNPRMFASAGDDGKVRIWSSENSLQGVSKQSVFNGSQRESNGW